jgi:hypothetical protein
VGQDRLSGPDPGSFGAVQAGAIPAVATFEQGTKRSTVVDAAGVPLGVVTAAANCHDSPLLAPTLDLSIAELNNAGLAHLPSGHFMANATWLALTVMAHNLSRAVGQLAGPDLNTATAATLRRNVFTMPGRLVHTGRHRSLRLPQNWPWAVAITTALDRITALPMRC